MKSNEDNETWISNILVRDIFFMFKTSLLLFNFCLYVYVRGNNVAMLSAAKRR